METAKNNIILIIITAVVLVGGGFAAFTVINSSNSPTSSNSTSGKSGATPIVAAKACDVLTETAAKQILGNSLDKSDTLSGDASTKDLSVSNCAYVTKADPNATSIPKGSGVTLMARVAKTQTGANNNISQFNGDQPGIQTVKGIGDKAFYSTTFRQLNVLKGGNWYIVTSFADSITNSSLDSDKTLAEKLHFK